MLRHLATIIYTGGKTYFDVNLKEVQVAMVLEGVHISANFHSALIADVLCKVFNNRKAMPEKCVSKDKIISPAKSRKIRHSNFMFNFFLNEVEFKKIVDKGRNEIKERRGVPAGFDASLDDVVVQFDRQMNSLFASLSLIFKGETSHISVHVAPHNLPRGFRGKADTTITRHAERNIVNFIAENKERIYKKSLDFCGFPAEKKIIVPLEGRFVPCGFCYDQECLDKTIGGVFNPAANKLILHRSTSGVGKYYENEIQYVAYLGFDADTSVAYEKSKELLSTIARQPKKLESQSSPLNAVTAFNADSEDSDVENA